MEPENPTYAIQKKFMDALNVDDGIATALIGSGFTTIEAIVPVSLFTLAAIEGFNLGIAVEIQARARNRLAERKNEFASRYVPAPPSGNTPTRRGRGRPLKEKRKVTLAIRIDGATLSRLRATGTGWQTRAGQGLKLLLDEGRI